MKTIRILALHLAYGGIEKAIISMANLFVERYEVEILSIYKMPDAPAFPLDERVKVRYLMDDIPNREQWKAACRTKNPVAILREGFRSVKILLEKKSCAIRAIRDTRDGVLISTRPEHNLLLSRYGRDEVLKIAQFHQDHRFEQRYCKAFREGYSRIDIFAHLAPSLRDEVGEMMKENTHTKHVFVPNFLEHFPDMSDVTAREKTIVSVGRLHPGKGFDRLIRIFAKLSKDFPDWTLKIIGDGEERENLERQIESSALSGRVLLTGKMDSGSLEAELKKASVFAMSSHSEGVSFVLLEAQSCGLPLVVFDVRVGAGMVIRDGINGFLIPDGDEDAFAAKLKELMRSPDLCEEIGKNAMARAQDFSRENVARIWFAVLENQVECEYKR